MTYSNWASRPLGVAVALDRGECGGSYVEACILVSGVISAIAADQWPGTGIDQQRFVEAWVRFAGSPEASWVSLPLLRRTLVESRRFEEAKALEALRPDFFRPGHDCRVVTGEIDVDEQEAIKACPGLTLYEIRSHTYPNVFYRYVRSQLVHEYGFASGGWAAGVAMTTRHDATVSYVNELAKSEQPVAGSDGIEKNVRSRHVVRRIHFHMPWLVDVAKTIARKADEADKEPGRSTRPLEWWLPKKPKQPKS
ncbi:MAG: hypothetical protein IPK71_01585 [Myxococcales bacterium]|nr:hypothetical protein [Myxococcales bacterium]